MMSAPEETNGAHNKPKPIKNKTKRPRKPTAHEDVVDGFTFLAFKNYEELQRAVKLGGEEKKVCMTVVGKQHRATVGVSVSTNTSPLTPKNKLKVAHKYKPKKLMDQENGEGSSKPHVKKHKDKESRLAKHVRESDEKGDCNKISTDPQNCQKEGSACSAPTNDKEGPEVKVGEAPRAFFKSAPPIPTSSPPLIASDPPITCSTLAPQHSTSAATQPPPLNGHSHGGEGAASSSSSSSNVINTNPPKVSSFFTPYATNAITRISVDSNNVSKPVVDKADKVIPTVSSKSLVFGSIVRLLDSPTTSSSSSNRSSPGGGPPRNHSPPSVTTEDRDSYSSNVSSLSRTSVTPVSAPPNLSPQLPYSKAANWLSSVVPVPRPTPPPLGSPFPSPAMFAPLHHLPPDHMQGTSADMVRRDLESRLNNGRDLPPPPMSLLPPNSMGSQSSLYPQSTMFKEMPKMESSLYRVPYTSPPFNGFLPQTPFAPPPSQMPVYPAKKTGRWNAMHVRIAWEIYQHQHKGSTVPPPLSRAQLPFKTSDLFRPPPQLYPPTRPHDLYPSSLVSHTFDQSLFLPPSLGGMRYPNYGGGMYSYPSLALPPQDQWARLGSRSGWSEVKRPTSPFRERSPVRINGGESRSSSDHAKEDKSRVSLSDKPHSSSRMFPTSSPLPPSLYSPYTTGDFHHHHPAHLGVSERERDLQLQQRSVPSSSQGKEEAVKEER